MAFALVPYLRLACLFVLFSAAVLGPCARAQPAASADELKAAYLYRFTGFVEWPASSFAAPDSPLVIGVAGADALLPLLSTMVDGRTVHGRRIAARKVVPGDRLDGVHMLFIAREVTPPAGWMKAARERSVLVVTEVPNGLSSGGVLNFVLANEHVRFEASVAAASQAGLKLSSRLLAVAARVLTDP